MKIVMVEICKWMLGNVEDAVMRAGKLLYKWETGKNPPTMQELLRQSLAGSKTGSIFDLGAPEKKGNDRN